MNPTPGPWKVGADEPFVYTLNEQGTNRFFVAVQAGWIGPNRTSNEELLANARLIAAAPDLLAALEEILKTCPADSDTTRKFEQAWGKALAAIAKAKGQS